MQNLKQLVLLYLLTLLAALFGCEDENCEGLVYYGPPSCESDKECQEKHDAGNWYCDKNNERKSDSCGNMSKWPICKEKDAG